MAGQIKTIDELEALYYGYNRNLLLKADAPLLTSTTGVFNTVYGAYAWAQLNLEANAFGVLPKYPWDKSGVRFITASPTLTTTNGNTVLGGTAEGGTIANTAKPTLATLDLTPKTAQLPFDASEVMEWLANHSKDDIWGGLGSLRLFMAVQHKQFINQMLCASVDSSSQVSTGNFTGTNDFETLDRIISSYGEATIPGIQNSNTGWFNPYDGVTIDRDSSTDKFDSTVQSPSGTLGTLGILTDNVLRTFTRTIRKAIGKDPTVLLGSHEAYSEVQGIYMPSVRIPNPYSEALVQVDVNGIQTFKGTGVGIHVDTVYGIPFIPTQNAPTNSNASGENVGRIFALDTSDAEGFGYPRIGFMTAIPTEYYEATRRTPGYPFVNAAFVEKAVFRTMGQNVGRNFKAFGKLRDIEL